MLFVVLRMSYWLSRVCKALTGFIKGVIGRVRTNPSQGIPLAVLLVLTTYFILAFTVHMLLKMVRSHETAPSEAWPSVRVMSLTPQDKAVSLTLKGLVEPSRQVTLRPRTEGYLKEILCKPGDHVQQGQVLALLTTDQREAQRAEAAADLKHKELEFQVAQSLAKNDYQSKAHLAQTRAALERSKLNLRKAELDLDYMKIMAPFAGYVGDILIREGMYLSTMDPGSGVLTLIEMNPFHVVSYITEKDYPFIQKDMKATLSDAQGKIWAGVVYALSPTADPQTRSYKLEIRCSNSTHEAIPAGMTVDIQMVKETRLAYALKMSSLCLDDQGVWGIKTVGPHQEVRFDPIHLINFEADSVWVSAEGLPSPLRLITVGHGFVTVGQKVQAVDGVESPS